MLAVLPMYDFPALRAATDGWWRAVAQALRDRGHAVPARLTRPATLPADWLNHALVLGQTCGWPLRFELGARVQVVATPQYAVPGCTNASYTSAVLVRADDPATGIMETRGYRAVFNQPDSQSGYSALRALVAPHAHAGRFFRSVLASGSHAASAGAVAAGVADLCAIDCVTWHYLGVTGAAPANLRVLTWTATAPALPYITAASTDPTLLCDLRHALEAARTAPQAADAVARLALAGFSVLPTDAYGAIDEMLMLAVRQGYPVLA